MTENEKKVLEGFLSKTLKIDTEDMASLYNEAGELENLTLAITADSERIKKIKEEGSSQYKRGVKEGASKLEKELREKYETDSQLEGVELFEHLLSEQIEAIKGKDEDITKHPEFIRATLERDKQLKAKDKEWQQKIDDLTADFEKRALLTKVKERAVIALDGLNPVLPDDAKKAARWRAMFADEVARHEYQQHDEGFAVIKDGKPATDDHGYAITFDDHIKRIADGMFEFRKAEDRSGSGSKPGERLNVPTPRNDDEYVEAMRKAATPAERIAIKNAYKKE